ncbi:alpha/beta hydrolase [Roseovarius sp. EGI FJ00037]|uniref:alpha/beta hydrolase n=1 Tax=Roseovarius salincola TaxID=2978479 RepID=UPI0022A829D4|nr:alpha/beta hydrolase [Roseovarius sp. EGI FJ00037]MCZ0813629.1 alpha/beta hydrolase [Roseovarius sp. EGI FJ00037]
MSLRRHILNHSLRLVEKPLLARAGDPVALRAMFERKARFWFRPPRGSHFSSEVIDGVPVCWALGKDVPARKAAAVILYLHGGGYVFGSSRTHRAMLARLSGLSGVAACLPDYRLAPEHAFPAALEDALAVYIELSAEREVIIGGDSAGGGLALALLGEILRHGLRPPRGVFCFSPLTDMTFSGDSMASNADADVLLPVARAGELAEMYLQGSSARDPRASPLLASLRGAPPVWITAGDTEILLDDTRRMAARLRADRVRVTEVIAHDLPHVWPIFGPLLPEACRTLEDVAKWISSLSRPQGDS